MAATTPAHYIRSIHTSFTAASAHPRNSSSWASAAAPRYAPVVHNNQKEKDIHLASQQAAAASQQQQPHQATQFNQYQFQQHQTGQHHQYNPPSISTHNSHTYTHHLYALHGGPVYPSVVPSGGQKEGYVQSGLRKGPAVVGAPTSGRRRSVSIRMPPTYSPQRARVPAYKFDPFADDEMSASAPLSVTTPLSGSSQANRGPVEDEEPLHKQQHAAPYTIHIPAAQPTEIQQYTPPPSPRPAARTIALRSLAPINGPLPGTAPSMQPRQAAQPTPNLSKIVAGILLNRVHAVGKPMRRRVMPQLDGEKGYRKSCLSSVVSCEA